MRPSSEPYGLSRPLSVSGTLTPACGAGLEVRISHGRSAADPHRHID
jgi:hypothetical protein